ncbi:MAG: hypothetical protein O2930_00285 [Acidobacteria bacterium]|nr:hypothetical protein [Acidobacteriota bacterium]
MTVENPPAPPPPRVTTGQTLIPGAYERRPLRPRPTGAMSGPAFGSPDMPGASQSMSTAMIADRRKEGGG